MSERKQVTWAKEQHDRAKREKSHLFAIAVNPDHAADPTDGLIATGLCTKEQAIRLWNLFAEISEESSKKNRRKKVT